MTIDPVSLLSPNKPHDVTLNTSLTDVAGNPLVTFFLRFTTAP